MRRRTLPCVVAAFTTAIVLAPAAPAGGSSTQALSGRSPAAAARTVSSAAQSALVAKSGRRPAVVERVVIGRSRKGRPIVAYRLGNPKAKRSAVVMAAIHGDERKPRVILRNLRDGKPLKGLDLWVIVNANPDGVARRARGNARGVDLNRNYPRAWKRSKKGTATWSGPKATSEPETRATMRFLRRTAPDQVVSFHQPLYGIDTSGNGNRKLARRLAKHLNLPKRTFSCGSGCHGTLSQWFNHRLDGQLVTVELGRKPSKRYLNKVAPRGLLRALRARR